MRRPIAMTSDPNCLRVLCNDGSTWRLVNGWDKDRGGWERWEETLPIPGSAREQEEQQSLAQGPSHIAERTA